MTVHVLVHCYILQTAHSRVTHEWLREMSLPRLECGVHDRLHIYSLCGSFTSPGIEPHEGLSVSSERHRLCGVNELGQVSKRCSNYRASQEIQSLMLRARLLHLKYNMTGPRIKPQTTACQTDETYCVPTCEWPCLL